MAARPASSAISCTRRELLAACAILASGSALAAEPEVFTFDTLYKSIGVMGIVYSDRLVAAKGNEISLTGYMAPPLKAESTFFVLTREPMAICPFCQSDADWPIDIIVVYLAAMSPLVGAGTKVRVTGRIEIGSWTDPETGFVSQLRLRDADYRRV
ncbi:MAG: hypothetical protein P4L82_09455 [Ancalomicrobiaceae bacterium]|nr:hypothetical protein [Ancalomicrobiaceae bacterium]